MKRRGHSDRCDFCGLRSPQLRAAERLADAAAVLVRLGRVDARSNLADRLLDYREPPFSERSEQRAAEIREALQASRGVGSGGLYHYEIETIEHEHRRRVIPADLAPERVECEACSWLWPCPTIRLLRRALAVERLDHAWPLADVLVVLGDFAEHALGVHSCDADGHERVRDAIGMAADAVAILRGAS